MSRHRNHIGHERDIDGQHDRRLCPHQVHALRRGRSAHGVRAKCAHQRNQGDERRDHDAERTDGIIRILAERDDPAERRILFGEQERRVKQRSED